MAATQCIECDQGDLLKIKWRIRTTKRGDLSDTECIKVVGVRLG